MRSSTLCMAAAAALIGSSAATAAPQTAMSPFSVEPVADAALATVVGAGEPKWHTSFRLSDELSSSSFRQTASIGSILKDLWLIDFASPLIAANVRAVPGR